MEVLYLPDQPFPQRKWLGMGVVDAKDGHPLVDPEQHDPAQLDLETLPVFSGEINRIDVFIRLWRVFGIFDRTVRANVEPGRMLDCPGVVRSDLNGEVESDLDAAVSRFLDKAMKVLQRAERGLDGVMTPGGASDGVGAARIARKCGDGIVAPLAVDFTDGVNGRKVEDIKTHLLDFVEPGDHVIKRATLSRHRSRRARKQLIPRRATRLEAIHNDFEGP